MTLTQGLHELKRPACMSPGLAGFPTGDAKRVGARKRQNKNFRIAVRVNSSVVFQPTIQKWSLFKRTFFSNRDAGMLEAYGNRSFTR